MSFHVFFGMSLGLEKTLMVPKGTKQSCTAHVSAVEHALGLKTTRYGEDPPHWDLSVGRKGRPFGEVSDETLCKTVEEHNQWVRRLYQNMVQWAERPVAGGEELSPDDAERFWHGLETLTVPPARWTPAYFRARMESLYEVMRGRESEGTTFDTKALTTKQAAAVIRIFDQYLDPGDLRLDVPHGHDFLASSYDGGYDWCGGCCRAMLPDDSIGCRRRNCELRSDNE